MALKVAILSSIICLFLLTVNSARIVSPIESLKESQTDDADVETCQGENPDARCALRCLMYPMFIDGYCNANNKCTCLRKPTGSPSKNPVPNGPCETDQGDVKCSLTCLFFKQFVDGFCSGGTCFCALK